MQLLKEYFDKPIIKLIEIIIPEITIANGVLKFFIINNIAIDI